ncbi:hypothetical protein TRFO_35719 [Tritrichomonas foetus]|uniref:HEAT repeat family protein n=1 Tax=Tritrichomonas foetus TaxID=1144522 RepID=A0A1J4JFR0_9EUKA|nr:hypothetical protein TRFO_35719 [Tritrichomonas foetus]|eukprot:OHS97952.1 hypothetical protein TRFO_35719 [Tritrichomonas foetus]
MITSLPRDFKSFPNLKCNSMISISTDFDVSAAIKSNDVSLYPQILAEFKKFNDSDSAKLADDFIAQLFKSFVAAPVKNQKSITSMIESLMSFIKDDEKKIQLIMKVSANSDCRLRALAPSLIKFVDNPQRLRNCFFSLTLDRVSSVRKSTVLSLVDAKFDIRSLEAMLRNAVNDRDASVKNAAAEVIGDVAPHLIKEYCLLLENKLSSQVALKSIEKFVNSHNGIKLFYKSMATAINNFPIEGGEALLIASKYAQKDELDLLIILAEQLTTCESFMLKFNQFAEVFEDKSKLLSLLSIKNINSWRQRVVILRNCVELAKFLPDQIAEKAIEFSCDDVAVVRTSSIVLWQKLISIDEKYINDLEKLLDESWQARIIAAKVIGIIGIDKFQSISEKLRNDEVENVRKCIEEHINL